MNDHLARMHADAIAATLGPTGRLLGVSKTGYREAHAGHAVVFNANVCLPEEKVWYGDIDLTTDEPLLADLATRTDQIVHLLYEHDARFRNEDTPQLDKAVYSITPSGHTRLEHNSLERRLDGQIYERPRPQPPRWRRPGRPRLWRAWHVGVRTERGRSDLGTHSSQFVMIGARDGDVHSPYLAFGLHHWGREARGGWAEAAWHPSEHRAWAPSIASRLQSHGDYPRLFVSVRLAPGVIYQFRLGVILDQPTTSGADHDPVRTPPRVPVTMSTAKLHHYVRQMILRRFSSEPAAENGPLIVWEKSTGQTRGFRAR